METPTPSRSEKEYVKYINDLIDKPETDPKYIVEVLVEATNMYHDSLPLWELYMQYHVGTDESVKLHEVFRKAKKNLPLEKTVSLWHLMLQYYQLTPFLHHKIDTFYLEAINLRSEHFSNFKVQYLQWIALTKGFEAARRLYSYLILIPPPCLELHQKMLSYESRRIKPKIEEWRKCYEHAVHFFGKKKEIWDDYIKFETEHGLTKNVRKLKHRAKVAASKARREERAEERKRKEKESKAGKTETEVMVSEDTTDRDDTDENSCNKITSTQSTD